MTATDLAAALLRDVSRYVLADGGGMKEDSIGAYVHWHDLIAALTAALDGVDERAVEVLDAAAKAQEWMRYPDDAESISLTGLAEWVNRRPASVIPALVSVAQSLLVQIAALRAERDALATANYRQAACIHATAANLGPDYSATVDGLPKAARHVSAEGDALRGAVQGLVEVLDQNEMKGPLPDTALMLCWLAAQNVRAVLRGYMLEKPE